MDSGLFHVLKIFSDFPASFSLGTRNKLSGGLIGCIREENYVENVIKTVGGAIG